MPREIVSIKTTSLKSDIIYSVWDDITRDMRKMLLLQEKNKQKFISPSLKLKKKVSKEKDQ